MIHIWIHAFLMRTSKFCPWLVLKFCIIRTSIVLLRPSTREPCRGRYRGGGVTDLAYNLHAVITWCSIVKYGVVLV